MILQLTSTKNSLVDALENYSAKPIFRLNAVYQIGEMFTVNGEYLYSYQPIEGDSYLKNIQSWRKEFSKDEYNYLLTNLQIDVPQDATPYETRIAEYKAVALYVIEQEKKFGLKASNYE